MSWKGSLNGSKKISRKFNKHFWEKWNILSVCSRICVFEWNWLVELKTNKWIWPVDSKTRVYKEDLFAPLGFSVSLKLKLTTCHWFVCWLCGFLGNSREHSSLFIYVYELSRLPAYLKIHGSVNFEAREKFIKQRF